MKKYILTTLSLLSTVIFLSCEKDGPVPVLKEQITAPVLQDMASSSYILLKANGEDLFDKFQWAPADYGFPAAVYYTVQMDKKDNQFANPVNLLSSDSLSGSVTVASFNASCTALELEAEITNQVEIRVRALIQKAEVDTVYSNTILMNVTPYIAKDPLYVVGSYNGWNNNTALEMNRKLTGLNYELYVNLVPNEWGFKLLPKLGSWDNDMGDDPGNPGHIISEGENNMFNPGGNSDFDGYYLIQVNLGNKTWKVTEMSWGIIGSATPGGWANDSDMIFQSAQNIWSITLDLSAGDIKFRANDAWTFNYGDNGEDGKLEPDGSNINIAAPGNYTITMSLAPAGNYTYSLVKN